MFLTPRKCKKGLNTKNLRTSYSAVINSGDEVTKVTSRPTKRFTTNVSFLVAGILLC